MTKPTTYYRPRELGEALRYANQPGSVAFAGGGLLLGGVQLPYEVVVDLQDIAEWQAITTQSETVRIGGATPLQTLMESEYLPAALKRAISRTLPVNVRSGVSVGEALAYHDPPREFLAALTAMDAVVEHAGYRKGGLSLDPPQQVDLPGFLAALVERGYPYAGIVTAVSLPRLRDGDRLGLAFVARTPADIPIVNAAARITLDASGRIERAVVALGGVDQLPVVRRLLDNLEGQPLAPDPIAAAAESVGGRINPPGDYRGSSEYRREMAVVMTRRALMECVTPPAHDASQVR